MNTTDFLACIGGGALIVAAFAILVMVADNHEFKRKQTRKP